MVFRILSILLLTFSVLFMPFWLSVLLGLSIAAYFPFFLEGIVIFFLSDLLYGVPEVKFYGVTYASLVGAVLILIGIEFLKKRLKYYPNIDNY